MTGSNYITPEGALRLRREVEQLWSHERPRVTQEVSDAAAQGDRSENAEYIYGKKRLREIDRRVRFLTKRLEALTVVDEIPDDQQRIFFGAWVKLEDEAGEQAVYRIVGPDEFDPKAHWISIDSPMAKALLRKRVGDEVVVRRPRGDGVYDVIDVWYGAKQREK